MCGIAGLYPAEALEPEELAGLVRAMGQRQRHRGPDGAGVWADEAVGLGCVRLAITGDDVHGAQPFRDRWGCYAVFNGELYEHERVLRELGERVPPEASDGFALAAVLGRRGPDALAGVRGMFACARYDPATRRLLLVRDALGKKPLYLRRFRGGWAFASTLAALRAATGPLEVRPDAMLEYLIFRSVGGYRTAFRDVEQLPPGCWIEIGPGGRTRRGRWWSPPAVCSVAASAAEVRHLLDAAVATRTWPNHPMAVFLSGGLDSAIVGASLRRQQPDAPVRFFSIGYEVEGPEDERPYARRLAEHFGGPHEDLQLTAAEVPSLLAEVARFTEDPIQDPVTLPTLVLARAAARHTKVVLTGDGSDEIWGGYARFDDIPPALEQYLRRTMIFSPAELGLDAPPAGYLDQIAPPAAELAPLDRVLRLEVANRLRNYHLSRVDKLTMAAGLEARCPFLDVPVVNLGLSLPSAVKRPGGRPKGLLADAFAADLPPWLLERRKQPFSVPIRAWLAGPLRAFALDTLLAPNAFTRRFVDARPYLAAIERATPAAEAAAGKVWSLLQLEVWQREAAAPLGAPDDAEERR